MARRRTVITGTGVVSGLGIGLDPLWTAMCEGQSGIRRIASFDPSTFDSQIASEWVEFKIRDFVPKKARKNTKVMCRDIALAVAAADLAARHAALTTPGIDEAAERSYPGHRTGCHIGAGLITADLDELTSALSTSTQEDGSFDIHHWGREGINNLTPLWLLKYLPNMLACHVTIIHDLQGPSNALTCCEASGGLSVSESMRVIERGAADACFCGGAESKLHPMTFYRQVDAGRLNTQDNASPETAVRPFDRSAAGSVAGEGGGILILEAAETAEARGAQVLAELVGCGAGHTTHPRRNGLEPDAEGRGICSAIRAALRDAKIGPDQIDLIVPFGSAMPAYDEAEAAAFATLFGDRLSNVPIFSTKPYVGVCGAGVGGIDIAVTAKALSEQTLPARLNCDDPMDGMASAGTAPSQAASLTHALVVSESMGGQNVAVVLKRADA
jgi:3-oxoacyl-[acyl-carrier-protein] synthase II